MCLTIFGLATAWDMMNPLWMAYVMALIFRNTLLKHKSVEDEARRLIAHYFEKQDFIK